MDGGAVGEHLGDALHHLSGVVAHAYDGVGAVLSGVLQHQLECVLACLLAELRQNCDISADNRLKSSGEIADELHLSIDAVKSHLRTLFQRFGIEHLPQNQKRSRLVAEALQAGVVSTRDL